MLAERDVPTVLVTDRGIEGEICRALPNLVDVVILDDANLNRVLVEIAPVVRGREVVGCLNTVEDFVVSAATLASHLSLPNPGLFAATLSRSKILQRLHLQAWSPACKVIGPDFADEIIQPGVVLKQSDGTGGGGVRYLKCASSAQDLFDLDRSPSSCFLIEELVSGQDVSVESLAVSGDIIFENIVEEDNLENAGCFLEMGYTIGPSISESAVSQRLYQINRDIVRAIGLQTGICHAEYRITESGDIYFIELAARPPGDGLMQLYQLSTGKRLEQTIVELCLGEAPRHPKPQAFARQIYFGPHQGKIDSVASEHGNLLPVHYCNTQRPRPSVPLHEPMAKGGLQQVLVEQPIGSEIPSLRKAQDRIGSFIFSAPTWAELVTLEQEIKADLSLKVV